MPPSRRRPLRRCRVSAHKHTPGPWSVLQEDVGGVLLGFGVASIADLLSTGSWYAISCSVKPNDARLIAAAPELLEALNKLTSFVVTDVVESCNGNKCREPWCAGCFGEEVAEQTIREAQEALDAARAAIAKATGEPA